MGCSQTEKPSRCSPSDMLGSLLPSREQVHLTTEGQWGQAWSGPQLTQHKISSESWQCKLGMCSRLASVKENKVEPAMGCQSSYHFLLPSVPRQHPSAGVGSREVTGWREWPDKYPGAAFLSCVGQASNASLFSTFFICKMRLLAGPTWARVVRKLPKVFGCSTAHSSAWFDPSL